MPRHREPVGLDWSPVARPARRPLSGERVVLAPVEPDRDAGALFAATHGGADARLWDYLPYGPFADAGSLRAWLAQSARSEDPLFFTLLDRVSGLPSGRAAYMRMEPVHGVIEIGHIFFVPLLQRTPAATEAIFLLARHVFDDLGYRRLEWKCDAANARSRRAAERFGFTYEGTFRQHMVVKGANRDTAWFSLLDAEWPAIRAGFEAWLDPANFDPDGAQRTPMRVR